MAESGVVFNIQKYSVHDGPGIRTVVFLKGCPLHCLWCSNPESQKPGPQLIYNRNKCLGIENCVRCLEVCTAGALKAGPENRVAIDRDVCTECLLCTSACPSRALNVYGEVLSVEQVLARVEEDGAFYTRSGGGLTLSGGEPMHQPQFALALLREARRRRLNTAMETCGFCRGEDLREACGLLDTLLYDLKSMDSEKHRENTGVSNELILENLHRVREDFPDLPIWVRTPLIPGFNDTVEEIRAIVEHIRTLPGIRYELLDYHRMGKPKYEYLGLEFPMGDRMLDEEKARAIRRFLKTEAPELLTPERPAAAAESFGTGGR